MTPPELACVPGVSYVLIQPISKTKGEKMDAWEKIQAVADAYAADNEDKTLSLIDLRDGRTVRLTVEDFLRFSDFLQGHI